MGSAERASSYSYRCGRGSGRAVVAALAGEGAAVGPAARSQDEIGRAADLQS